MIILFIINVIIFKEERVFLIFLGVSNFVLVNNLDPGGLY
jgi:hypothetical protein